MHKFILAFCLTVLFGQYDYSLEDINPNSEYYGNYIGPETFREDVSLYYFGKAG